MNTVYAGLLAVQRDLKAPKNQYNSFGKYNYRSCEDILSAARPLCNENGLVLVLNDEPYTVDGWHFIEATATVIDVATGDSYSARASARESAEKKGMDSSQVTGATSSYARKYALCALFAIDDTKDFDSDVHAEKEHVPQSISHEQAADMNLEKIKKEVEKLGINFKMVSNIIKRKFHKDKYSELNTIQQNTLLTNLEAWSQEG